MSSGSRWRELGQDQWIEIAKAMYSRFGEVQINDRVAALTHYAVLSLFPGLLVAVAILALVGEYPRTYDSIVDTLRDAAPGTAVDAINSGLRDGLSDRGNAGALLGVGLVISLYARWSTGAASLVTAFAGTLAAMISFLIWLWLSALKRAPSRKSQRVRGGSR